MPARAPRGGGWPPPAAGGAAGGGDTHPRPPRHRDEKWAGPNNRHYSFFEEGCVVHMEFAQPYCPHMKSHLAESARDASAAEVVEDGTYVCIEGPQYSTKAESEHFRASGFEIIGMTAIPEAKLAREAELCYATVAGITDYDVWKDDAEVTLEEVLDNAAANEEFIKSTIRKAVESMPEERECDCGRAVEGAVNTPTEAIDAETRERVDLLVGDYL